MDANVEREFSRLVGSMERLTMLPAAHLGLLILQAPEFASLPQLKRRGPQPYYLNLPEFSRALKHPPTSLSEEAVVQVLPYLDEAWYWLITHDFLVPGPDWSISRISRKAERAIEDGDWDRTLRIEALPADLLHPLVRTHALPIYLTGDFDTAIFCALKRVEIAVRTKGGLGAGDVGKELMTKGLHPDSGVLADARAEPAEREGWYFLFRGALQALRNPAGHRDAGLTTAAEVLMLASLLLAYVDGRPQATAAP